MMGHVQRASYLWKLLFICNVIVGSSKHTSTLAYSHYQLHNYDKTNTIRSRVSNIDDFINRFAFV